MRTSCKKLRGPRLTVGQRGRTGPSMNVGAMIAAQTRIERQDTPHCATVSFDRHAANAFQSYVHAALAFSVKVRAAVFPG